MMKTRSLTAILTIVLVALVAGLRIFTEGEATRHAAEALELPAVAQARAPDVAPDFGLPANAGTHPTSAGQRVEAGPGAAGQEPVWLEGRVVFRAGTPRDEVLFVEARGDASLALGGEARVHRVRVGQDGRFRVAFAPGSTRGWLSIAARYQYLESARELDLLTPPRPLVLEPRLGGRLALRVVAPPGGDMSGVTARLRGGRPGSTDIQRFATLDPAGRCELSGLPPGGDWWLSVTAPNLVDLHRTDVSIAPGVLDTLELELKAGVALAGRVVNEFGAPVVGANLRVESTRRRGIGTRSETRYATSGADGAFALLGLEAGELVLACEARGAAELELSLGELRDGEERRRLHIELAAGESLEGVVLWPDGTPAAGARVRVTQVETEAWRTLGDASDETETSDGRFRFGGLEPKRSRLYASARRVGAGEEDTWIAELDDVAPGTRGLVLELGRGARLHGRVFDDLGRPVQRFEILLSPRVHEGELSQREEVSRVVESRDGRFELSGFEVGHWSLAARAGGHADAVLDELELPGDGAALQLELARLARVSGRVVDTLGASVPGATVGIRERSPEASLFGPVPTHTLRADETGRFVLEGVPPGAFELAAIGRELAPSAAHAIDVEPGGSYERIELRLRRPARLSGEIHAASPAVAGRVVEVRGLESQVVLRVATSVTGQFSFEGLSPGEYSVCLEPPDEQANTPADPARWRLRDARREELRVELSSGEARHLVLGAPAQRPILVRGRVLQEERGVANATVTARGAIASERPSEQGARTGPEGRFEMTLDGAGPYSFSVGSEWGTTIDFEVEVPQRRLFELELGLPAASLAGIVRGPTGEPLAQVSVALIPRGEGGTRNGWALSATTDTEGRYEFRHLRGGTYDLQAGGASRVGARSDAPVYGRVLLPEVGVADGERREGFDISLRPGGAIEGVVVGADGAPLAHARVEFEDSRGRPLFAWSSTTTDAQGRFRQEGVGAGRVRVLARHEGRPGEAREVSVIEGGTSEVQLWVRE